MTTPSDLCMHEHHVVEMKAQILDIFKAAPTLWMTWETVFENLPRDAEWLGFMPLGRTRCGLEVLAEEGVLEKRPPYRSDIKNALCRLAVQK